MKKNLLTKPSLLIIAIILSCNLAHSQEKVTKLGLVAELVYAKATAEGYFTGNYQSIINNTVLGSALQKESIVIITGRYLRLKEVYDQLILQLEADMYVKNSVRVFKKLDRRLTERKIDDIDVRRTFLNLYPKVDKYAFGLWKANITLEDSIGTNGNKQSGMKLLGLSIEQGLSILPLAESTIKDINDINAGKVSKVCTLLDGLRFSNVKDLISPADAKKDK